MDSAFTIRAATPGDERAVGAVLEASYPVLMRQSYDPDVLAAALPAVTRANPDLLRSGTYYVAEDRVRRAVGCGGWTRERPGTGEIEDGLAHLRHFATHPDWIGRSVGRAIYTVCVRQARAAGVIRLECQSSLNAEGFYAALGFQGIRRMDVDMSPHHPLPSVLMRRSL